jgi:hypothetical protein
LRVAKPTTKVVFAKALEYAEHTPIAGLHLAQLATALSGLPHKDRVVQRVLAELVEHPNPSGRRIGIHACRRIGRFQAVGLREALVRRLADGDPWVRYDAAWAIHDAGYDGPDVREALGVLASGVRLPADETRLRASPSDAVLAGRVRARQALDALLAGSAPDAEPGAAADGGGM